MTGSAGRAVTLFTGQWVDVDLEKLAVMARGWGYDGLELACDERHLSVPSVLTDPAYRARLRNTLTQHDLQCWAVASHQVGQAVCDDPIDDRHRNILPRRLWGDGEPEGVRQRAAAEMKDTARAAAALDVELVVGFTGSQIWPMLSGFPPITRERVTAGYTDFAERWAPILDVFESEGVRFALEVCPAQIAYDYWTTTTTIEMLADRASFGINVDPSHLLWQGIDPTEFLRRFGSRVYHFHCKDVGIRLDGRNGVLASHLAFGDHRRGWDFRTVGRGDVAWEDVFRALNEINYQGPISVEWEDSGQEREAAATEACEFVRRTMMQPSRTAFDAAFVRDEDAVQARGEEMRRE
jgi:sugar phosphate isomerase/epimerase